MRRHDRQNSESDGDVHFVAEVVHAWGNRKLFTELADRISPTIEVARVRTVELRIERVARQVWDGTPNLDLIGSTKRGTNIFKDISNRVQSDRDYSLSTGSGVVTEEEWNDFYRKLREEFEKRGEDRAFRFEKGQKAITICDLIGVDWEIVPKEGGFTFDMVTYPSIEGSTSRAERDRLWEEQYDIHPGTRNAAKILKRLFPELKGFIIEALVYTQGKVTSTQGLPFRGAHSGIRVFEQLMDAFHVYPDGDPESPLMKFRRDANQIEYHIASIEQKILTAKRRVRDIRIQRKCDQPAQCVSLGTSQAFCALLGLVIGLLLAMLLYLSFNALDIDSVVTAVRTCHDKSCFCTDCRYANIWGRGHLEQWEKYTCSFFGVLQLNRCGIAIVMNSMTFIMYGGVAYLSLSSLQRTSLDLKGRASIHLLVALMSTLGFIRMLDYPGIQHIVNRVMLAALSYSIVNACHLGVSISALILVIDVRDSIDRARTHSESLCSYFLAGFLPTVLVSEVCVVLVCRFGRHATDCDFAKQSFLFYTLSLLLGIILAVIGCVWSSKRSSTQFSRQCLLTHIFWLLVHCAFLFFGIYYPERLSKWNLLTMFGERVATFWKMILAVRFANRTKQNQLTNLSFIVHYNANGVGNL